MRLAKHKRKTRMQMDMTPMIDVAFQLIIFFMTVSQMTQASQERLQLPKQPGVEEAEPRQVIINVTAAGEFVINRETFTLPQLISRLGQELLRVGDDPAKLNIAIRADERCESRAVNEVVTALGRMRLTRIRIAVESGG